MQEKRSILEADGYFIKLKLVVEFFIFQRNDIANRKIAIAKTFGNILNLPLSALRNIDINPASTIDLGSLNNKPGPDLFFHGTLSEALKRHEPFKYLKQP